MGVARNAFGTVFAGFGSPGVIKAWFLCGFNFENLQCRLSGLCEVVYSTSAEIVNHFVSSAVSHCCASSHLEIEQARKGLDLAK